MATIKQGYDNKPLVIRVYPSDHNDGKAQIWTEMFDGVKASDYQIQGDDLNSDKFRTEVLHYAALSELIELRDELNSVIKEIAGV